MAAPKIDPREFLKRLPLFGDFDAAELSLIAAGTTELHISRGQPVFHRGDPCHGFFSVVYGQVKLGFVSAQGNEKIIEIVGPGHSFGEALMFMERPYILNAHALGDTLLLHISKAAVFDELEHNPAFARRMLAGMSRRVHSLISDVESYSLRSGSQRIVGYLLNAQPPGEMRVLLSASKKLIASRLNLTPEYFSRVLHELVSRGMIALRGREVTILDQDGLRAFAA
jgi:CRP/FNR family transcriptional regulator, dissimilatory nitrate respiration regulator